VIGGLLAEHRRPGVGHRRYAAGRLHPGVGHRLYGGQSSAPWLRSSTAGSPVIGVLASVLGVLAWVIDGMAVRPRRPGVGHRR